MQLHRRLSCSIAGVLALAAAHCATAQNEQVPPDTMLVLRPGAMPATSSVVELVAGEARVIGDPVTGKPYSADTITETIQMLADGNRIVSSNTSRIYRDSAGRTRHEQTLTRLGAWPTGEQPVTIVTIDDPVAEVSYSLDPRERTARELRTYGFVVARRVEAGIAGIVEEPGSASQGFVVSRPPEVIMRRVWPGAGIGTVAPATPAAPLIAAAPAATSISVGIDSTANVRSEDLGERVMQGVVATGARRTQTIEAGAIGNEWPIDIVTETWYSEEIEALVSTRTFDPRFGETTYRLVNVVLGEPPADLFTVPQDYQILDENTPPAVATFGVGSGIPGERVELRVEPE